MNKTIKALNPIDLPSPDLAYNNHIYLSPSNYKILKEQTKSTPVYACLNGYVFIASPNKSVEDNKVALGKFPRRFMKISYTDSLDVSLYTPTDEIVQSLSSITFDIELGIGPHNLRVESEEKELESRFRRTFEAQYFSPGQIILMELQSAVLICTVKNTQLMDVGLDKAYSTKDLLGKLIDETIVEFKCTPSTNFTIKGQSSTVTQSIFKSDFKFEDMGVGGLDKEIYDIFRSAFASRRLSPSLLAKYGRNHVRGMLLYGPPGTGKTLIARQLAKVLRSKEPKIVNGPELLDKYVGEAERKVRLLFADAVKDEAQYGPNSPLHIIIFDEFDAICKKRGTVNNGCGVYDNLVNMILSMIDGVNSLNNILVIGMTNRKDVIDEAVLRSGRLEVHIEVGLPDEKGRQQILEIHTKKMKDNDLLAEDVSIEKLAKISKNFTGAELESIVKSASSRAITRTNNIFDFSKEAMITEESKVNFDDFLGALEDVKPMFGADTGKLEILSRNNLVNYGSRFTSNQEIIMELVEKLKNSQNSQLISVLLSGQKGTGKSALASWVALKSDFPFVKLISAEHFVEFTETGKVDAMVRVFEDAYKCPLSLIVIDDIERIIEYTNIGPRFSNHLLQAILVLTKKIPKKSNHKIMIIGTTSQASVLKDLEVVQGFDIIVDLPMLDQTEEIMKVLSTFSGEETEKEKIAKSLPNISIKKLLMLADVALDGKNELVYDKFAKAYARSETHMIDDKISKKEIKTKITQIHKRIDK